MATTVPKQPSGAELLCPCGKASRSEIERIPRGFFIKTFVFWLLLKKYKCYKCTRKKWVIG
jgi:hypothetical protein